MNTNNLQGTIHAFFHRVKNLDMAPEYKMDNNASDL